MMESSMHLRRAFIRIIDSPKRGHLNKQCAHSHEAQSWVVRNNVDAIEMDLDSSDARTPKRGPFPRVSKSQRNGVSKFHCRNPIGFFCQLPWPNLSATAVDYCFVISATILARHYCTARYYSRSPPPTEWLARYNRYNQLFAFDISLYKLNPLHFQVQHKSGRLHCISGICFSPKYISALLSTTYLETVTWALYSDVFYTYRHWQIGFRDLISVSPDSQGSKRCTSQPQLPQFIYICLPGYLLIYGFGSKSLHVCSRRLVVFVTNQVSRCDDVDIAMRNQIH